MQIQILGNTNDSVQKVKDEFLKHIKDQSDAATQSESQIQG